MDNLEEIRKEINNTDEEITRLYEKRMQLMLEVAKYKLEQNIPIFDEKREEDVILINSEKLNDSSLKPQFIEFLKFLMDQGKDVQKRFIEANE